jgi:DNA repair protein RecO
MEQKRDLAIVLRWVPYEERHRVVTALTERHGRVSALARNSIQSRRFGGALEPFTAAEWRFVERPGADLVRLEGAEIRRAYEGLRGGLERLALASVFNELMLRVAPEREECPELFRLHANALAELDERPADTAAPEADLALLNGYLAKVLQWSGNQPQLAACLGCETPLGSLAPGTPLTCRVAEAGWICPSCRGTGTEHVRDREGQSLSHVLLRVTPAALDDLRACFALPVRQVPGAMTASLAERRALFAFLEGLFAYHVPGFDRTRLKGLRFLGLESDPGSSARPKAASLL